MSKNVCPEASSPITEVKWLRVMNILSKLNVNLPVRLEIITSKIYNWTWTKYNSVRLSQRILPFAVGYFWQIYGSFLGASHPSTYLHGKAKEGC